MEIKTRYIPTGIEMDASWSMTTDKDVRIDANGNWTESMVSQGTTRDLGNQFRLRDLVRSQAVEAPILLGMWINEHPDRFEIIQEDQFGNVVFRVQDMNWQATLAEASSPTRAWVSKLESIDNNGVLLSWYDFDDPVPVEGASVRIGSIRTPVSLKRQPTPREGLSANLKYARKAKPPAAPAQQSAQAVSSSAPESATPEPAPARSAIMWWLVGAVAILGLGSGAVLWLRRSA